MKPTNPYSDSELLLLLQQKDKQACDWLYEKYAAALHGLVSQILPETRNISPILEKIFSRIFREIDTYNPLNSRLFTWMLGITRSTAIEELRRARPAAQSVSAMNPVYKDAEGLGHILKRLAPEEKEIIGLSYFKGYSIEDIARHLNMPVEMAGKKVKLALVQLKMFL